MADVKCSLCGKTTRPQGKAAWPLCPTCAKTLPDKITDYSPEEIVQEVQMGSDAGSIFHGYGGYSGDLQNVAGEIWRVKSESSEKWYTVDLAIPKCDCTNWVTQRNKLVGQARTEGRPDSSVTYECKHCRAAKGAATALNKTDADNEKKKLEKKTAAIKAEFAATKTKKDALDMLKELGDL